MFEEILSLEGHQVRTYEDGAGAVDDFRRQPANLVISDLGMPDVSGWHVAQSIREISPATPIVFITAVGEYVDPQKVKSLGVLAVLRKPFRLTQIKDILQAIG